MPTSPKTIPAMTSDSPAAHRMGHIPELDGIRGLAALAVVFHHICYATVRVEQQPGWPASIRGLYWLTEYGGVGVDFFFVLSGFLISSILLQDRRSTRYYQEFYWKRALRILPLYLVCLLIMLAFEHQASYVAMAAFFIVNFASVFHVEGLGPFWTLAIEEQFYVLWPTVVRRKSVEQVRRWALGLVISAFTLRLLFALMGHFNYYLTFLRWDSLAFGALLACHFSKAGAHERLRRSWDTRLEGAAAAAMVIFVAIRWIKAPAMWQAWEQTGITLLATACVGLSISRTGARALAPLRSGVLTFFGLISYALYMLHTFFVALYGHIYGVLRAGAVQAYWIRLAGLLTASIAASLLSRYVVELPALRLRKFVLKHPNVHAEEEHPPLPLAPQ